MFRTPATIGKLIGNLGIAAFNMLAFGCRLSRGKRAIVILKGLRPHISKAVAVSAVVSSNMINYSHAALLNLAHTRSPSCQTHDERYDEQYEENEEQDLSDRGRRACNATESKRTGYQSYDQKYQRIIEHLSLHCLFQWKNDPDHAWFLTTQKSSINSLESWTHPRTKIHSD
jgi:hypothetical protein